MSRLSGLLAVLLAAYALSLIAFYVVARYRLLLAPFIVVFAAAALTRGAAYARNRGRTALAALAAAVVVAAVLWVGHIWSVVFAQKLRQPAPDLWMRASGGIAPQTSGLRPSGIPPAAAAGVGGAAWGL